MLSGFRYWLYKHQLAVIVYTHHLIIRLAPKLSIAFYQLDVIS